MEALLVATLLLVTLSISAQASHDRRDDIQAPRSGNQMAGSASEIQPPRGGEIHAPVNAEAARS